MVGELGGLSKCTIYTPVQMFRYEGAVKKEPANEEFLSHLFMAYVRQGVWSTINVMSF